MKKLLLSFLLSAGIIFSVCAQNIFDIGSSINTSTTWTSNNQYILHGYVYVNSPAVLTIEPGTVIKGALPTGNPGDTDPATLIVMKGAQLIADGTASNPIVFTSNEDPGSRNAGDWGGIVLCGNATVNAAGGTMTLEGGYGAVVGGGASPNDADNSGILRYVRIEFAGYPIITNQEINSLTMGGVGSGTTLDYIQISFANDDAFEWFGGTVNAKHLIAYKGVDDMFDSDNGFTGKVQYVLGISHPLITDVSGSNGFESDNDAGGTNNTPLTAPVFSNVTILGPKDAYTDVSGTDYDANFKRAAHIRRNSSLSLFNSVIGGFPTGLYIDGSKVATNINSGGSVFENNVIFAADGANGAHPTNKTVDTSSGIYPTVFNPVTWFAANNTEYDNASELMLTNPYAATPDAMPQGGSPLLSGASFVHAKLATGFDVVTYKGAFGSTDWTSGWTNWDPENASYILAVRHASKYIAGSKMYPNPVTDVAKIELELNSVSDVKITLSDLMGKEIKVITETKTSNVQEYFDVAGLAKGLYTVSYYINGEPAKADLLMVK
jgi:hypothetical protein